MRVVKSEVSKIFTLELTGEELATIVSGLAVSAHYTRMEFSKLESLEMLDGRKSQILYRSLKSLIV